MHVNIDLRTCWAKESSAESRVLHLSNQSFSFFFSDLELLLSVLNITELEIGVEKNLLLSVLVDRVSSRLI
jgi:hypothetical protein